MRAELGAEDGSRRSRTLLRSGLGVLAAVLLGLPGVVGQAGAEPVVGTRAAASESRLPEVIRLSGANREETAAAVAQYRRAESAVFVRSDRPLDAVAMAGWQLPVLFIPPTGPLSVGTRRVIEEFRSPGGSRVVGAEAILPARRLNQLLGPELWGSRANHPDATSMSVDTASYATTHEDEDITVFQTMLVTGYEPLAQSAVAWRSKDQAMVLVPPSGFLPRSARPAVRVNSHVNWSRTLAVGEKSSVSERSARLVSAFMGRGDGLSFGRVSGADRYETAALLNDPYYPEGASDAYLVNGISGVDAAILSGERSAPVLLVPPCGPLPDSVRQRLRTWRPSRLVVVGGPAAVCDDLVNEAASAYTTRPSATAREVVVAGYGACLLDTAGAVRCWGDLTGTRTPRIVPGLGSGVRTLSGGHGRCAVTHGGALLCWTQASIRAGTPPRVVPGLESGVLEIGSAPAGGTDLTVYAVKGDGTLWKAELAEESSRDPVPGRAEPMPGLSGVRSLTSTYAVSCALREKSEIWCWGYIRTSPGNVQKHPPTKLPNMPAEISEIQLYSGGLMIRDGEGQLFVVDQYSKWDHARPVPKGLPGAWRLGEDGTPCFIAVDGGLICHNPNHRRWPKESLASYRRIPTATPVTMVEAPWERGCFVIDGGRLQCWGLRWWAAGNGAEVGGGQPSFVIGYGG